ncbi:hypothetical protein V492_05731 [Pseudogymnoascus sp. VKM F-4246]|nr:hypothetical protein V492_05731 [Pseudogymnoascus sp. VKM F-4246]
MSNIGLALPNNASSKHRQHEVTQPNLARQTPTRPHRTSGVPQHTYPILPQYTIPDAYSHSMSKRMDFDPTGQMGYPQPQGMGNPYQQQQQQAQQQQQQQQQQQAQQQQQLLPPPEHLSASAARKRRLQAPLIPPQQSPNMPLQPPPTAVMEEQSPMNAAPAPMQPPAKKSRTNTLWTAAEEQRLKNMREAGNSWAEIAKTFPSRTEGSVKKHWYKDMHYAEFAEDESAALLNAIKEYETNKWKVIGQKVGKPAKACEQYAKEHFGNKS